MKKLIAVLLAALMCASVLMACGGGTSDSTAAPATEATKEATKEATEEASKEATQEVTEEAGKDDDWPAETYQAKFIIYVPNDAWPGADRVKAYIKEMTKKDLNIECEIVPMTFGSYAAQVPMMLSAREQIDVFVMSNAQIQYDQGYIIDLLDYKKQIQPALDLLGEEDIMASCINGHLLALPMQLERTHRYGMAMRTDLLEEVGYDPNTINDGDIEDAYDRATEIFAKIKEAHPEMTVFGGSKSSPPPCNTQHTDALTDAYGVLDNYGDNFDVVNYYETPYFNKSVSYMKKWYDAGYVQSDITVSNDGYEALVKAGNTFGGCCPMKPDSYAEKRDQCNYDMTIFYFREDMMLAYTGSGGYAVASTTKDPVQAARLISYSFTSREFNDAINWGEPGVDWVESPENDNVAMYPEGVDVSNAQWHNSFGWAYPNERIAHVWIGNDPDMYRKIYVEAEKDSHRTKAWGFIWDNTQYQDAISALDNVKEEYLYQIASGSVDVEAMSKEFNEKLFKSGLQDIMDEKQRQLDAWLEEKGISK